jgi:hypothetical protein
LPVALPAGAARKRVVPSHPRGVVVRGVRVTMSGEAGSDRSPSTAATSLAALSSVWFSRKMITTLLSGSAILKE